MPQINVIFSNDQKDKAEWLAKVKNDTQANIVRRALEAYYESEKSSHSADQEFLRWIRSNQK